MNLLVIDTAQFSMRAALVRGEKVVGQWERPAFAPGSGEAKPGGAILMKGIDELLQKTGTSLAEIDRITVNKGPGMYSSLRTGIVTATLLAHATGAELVGVAGESLGDLIEAGMREECQSAVTPVYK